MRQNVLYALALILITGMSAPAHAQAKMEQWNPPPGMEWDTPSGKCKPTRLGGPFIEGCYFGKVGEASEHAGLAFFRKCGPYRQMQPFLVVDFNTNSFTFNSDPSKQGARTQTGNLPPSGSIDPDPFLEQLPAINGPCWAPQGDPA